MLIVSVFYVVRPRAALPAGPPDQHQSAHVHPCNNTVSVTLQPDALPRRLPPTGQRLLATYHSAVFGIGSNTLAGASVLYMFCTYFHENVTHKSSVKLFRIIYFYYYRII